jgi:putative transposase
MRAPKHHRSYSHLLNERLCTTLSAARELLDGCCAGCTSSSRPLLAPAILQIAKRLGIDRGQVRTWRKRWIEATPRLIAAEEEVKEEKAGELLDDDSNSSNSSILITEVNRRGARRRAAQRYPSCDLHARAEICQIMALALEDPREESGRAVTHWTPPELADEAVKRGILESISPRSVGRFLGRGFI